MRGSGEAGLEASQDQIRTSTDILKEQPSFFAPGRDVLHFVFLVLFLPERERLHQPALEIRHADRIPSLGLTTHYDQDGSSFHRNESSTEGIPPRKAAPEDPLSARSGTA